MVTYLVAVSGSKGEPGIAKAPCGRRIGQHALNQILNGGAPAALHHCCPRHQIVPARHCSSQHRRQMMFFDPEIVLEHEEVFIDTSPLPSTTVAPDTELSPPPLLKPIQASDDGL